MRVILRIVIDLGITLVIEEWRLHWLSTKKAKKKKEKKKGQSFLKSNHEGHGNGLEQTVTELSWILAGRVRPAMGREKPAALT